MYEDREEQLNLEILQMKIDLKQKELEMKELKKEYEEEMNQKNEHIEILLKQYQDKMGMSMIVMEDEAGRIDLEQQIAFEVLRNVSQENFVVVDTGMETEMHNYTVDIVMWALKCEDNKDLHDICRFIADQLGHKFNLGTWQCIIGKRGNYAGAPVHNPLGLFICLENCQFSFLIYLQSQKPVSTFTQGEPLPQNLSPNKTTIKKDEGPKEFCDH